MMDIRQLSAEFPRECVHWRVQGQPYERNGTFSAMALAYLDARDVMDRLDDVCGPANWQDEYAETPKGRVICRLGVNTEFGWVWKSDGAGETAVEGEKGGISDALKRTAVKWGIGRYLYRLDSPWVRCEVSKKGDKVYWKRWAEDPWAKTRAGVYVSTIPEADEEAPAFDAVAATNRLILKMERAKTLEELAEGWEGKTAKEIELANANEYKRLIAAKDARKGTLAAALTMQGAG